MERGRMQVSDIKIPYLFANTTPNQEKMERCREYYSEHGRLDRDIVVNRGGKLKDGYIGLLVLIENNVNETEVAYACGVDTDPYKKCATTYVFGRHAEQPKEYCWRVTKNTQGIENLKIGNHALVKTARGVQTAMIVRIEQLENPPIKRAIKGVIRCLDE